MLLVHQELGSFKWYPNPQGYCLHLHTRSQPPPLLPWAQPLLLLQLLLPLPLLLLLQLQLQLLQQLGRRFGARDGPDNQVRHAALQ